MQSVYMASTAAAADAFEISIAAQSERRIPLIDRPSDGPNRASADRPSFHPSRWIASSGTNLRLTVGRAAGVGAETGREDDAGLDSTRLARVLIKDEDILSISMRCRRP